MKESLTLLFVAFAANACSTEKSVVGSQLTGPNAALGVASKTWTPVDLGFVPVSYGSVAVAISRSGTVLGYDYQSIQSLNAWVRRPNGQRIDLLPLPGDISSEPTDVSDAGIAIGASKGGLFGPYHPVYWKGNRVAQPIPGVPEGSAKQVSESGIIVGELTIAPFLGYRYRPGGTVEFLQPDVSYPYTKAHTVNNLGYVGGESNGAVVWTPSGKIIRIPTPTGYYAGAVLGINDLGDVTGFFVRSSDDVWRAFVIYKGQALQFLQSPPGRDFTVPLAIDKFGNVYGFAGVPGATYTDFIWVGGVPTPLPQHPTLGGYFQSINECGAMAGSGFDGSYYHAMKWTTTC